MKINEITQIASQHNIDPGKAKKSDLVRAIQEVEGNLACFESNTSAECGQESCLWREDCN